MNDYSPGSEGYAKFRCGYNGHNRNITAWVRIIEVTEYTVKFADDFKEYTKDKKSFKFGVKI